MASNELCMPCVPRSGWFDFEVGHVVDLHLYVGPGAPNATRNRARVLGEFGGLGYPVRTDSTVMGPLCSRGLCFRAAGCTSAGRSLLLARFV